jgi:hypothetical protein
MGRAEHGTNRRQQGDPSATGLRVRHRRRPRLARPRPGVERRAAARHPPHPRILRGVARRCRHRRRVHPAAEPSPRAVVDPRAPSRQARALREADRAEQRRGGDVDRRRPPLPSPEDHGSVHVPPPPAVAAHAGARRRRRHRPAAHGAGVLLLLECGPEKHPQRSRDGRRRTDGHRLLLRVARALPVRIRAAARARHGGARSGLRRRPACVRDAGVRRGHRDLHLRHPALTLPARERIRHGRTHRDRDSLQRSARPPEPDLAPARRQDRRDPAPRLRPVHAPGRPLRPRHPRRHPRPHPAGRRPREPARDRGAAGDSQTKFAHGTHGLRGIRKVCFYFRVVRVFRGPHCPCFDLS